MNAQEIIALVNRAEQDCAPVFHALEQNEMMHTRRVLACFQEENVAGRHFAPSTGYGFDDVGRDTLERIFSSLFGTESAIVRPHIVSGTAALSLCLFGLLLPGDHLLSATGMPYDTMQTVIGLTGNGIGSLIEMGVNYSQVEMTEEGLLELHSATGAPGEPRRSRSENHGKMSTFAARPAERQAVRSASVVLFCGTRGKRSPGRHRGSSCRCEGGPAIPEFPGHQPQAACSRLAEGIPQAEGGRPPRPALPSCTRARSSS